MNAATPTAIPSSAAASDTEVEQVVEGGERGSEGDGSCGSDGGDGCVERKEPEDCAMEDVGGGATGGRAATVFKIRLKQTPSNIRHKMRVPELCRNFSAVAWCGKLNAIACASETCARIPSSNANPPFWIPVHILNPERPTECAVFNVTADSPRDSVQFIEWSPRSCPRALLIANFSGRTTIWTQPWQGSVNVVRDASFWQCEHEWKQDLAVVTKWLFGIPPYRWLPSNASHANSKSSLEEKFLSQLPNSTARWPNFLCVCTVFSSGSVQLHWSQWPPTQNGAAPKLFSSSKGLLGAGPSGIMAADAIITEAGTLHVAGVPLVNPSTVVVWEVTPGPGNILQASSKISNLGSGVPASLNPNWMGYAPLAAYLFSWQEHWLSEGKQGMGFVDKDISEAISLHCSPVSNFSGYVNPEAAVQTAITTTWGSGVTAISFDPSHGGSVISVVIVEGQYMSPYDPDEGPSITGWRVQCWESSLQPVVLHPIFGNPVPSFGGQTPMQTVWVNKVNRSIPPTDDFKTSQNIAIPSQSEGKNSSDMSTDSGKWFTFDPYDLPSDVRMLAQIVYSAHGGEVAVAFLRGGVHIFSGENFHSVDSYQINVGSTIAAPAFSATGCCLASVWHDTRKDRTTLKIIRVLPPAVSTAQAKLNSASYERAIADRFWWSLLAGVDWWDAVGCSQSASEDGIVSLNSVIAVLDDDFHSLPSIQHRQQHGPNLDRIKCRLLEGTNAQDVRALVLDMQARLLLDMLGKGIESALVNPSTLLPDPWLASSEMLSGIDPDKMIVEPSLVQCIQAYVDAVLDLSSHFITRLRRYASFCRTLASHAVTSAGTGSTRNMVASPPHSSASPSANQGGQASGANFGTSQMQAWVQGAIAKISNNSDSGSTSASSTISSPSSFMPISINTGTFPGTPAVRLIGDCHFLHRLCQLLLFCLIFRRRQAPRLLGAVQKNPEPSLPKSQPNGTMKMEESVASRPLSGGVSRLEEVQLGRGGQVAAGAKVLEEGPIGRSLRLGTGNAGHGYTSEEVKVLFLTMLDLCRRTSSLSHPLPASQVGTSNVSIRLHYIDGNYTVLPEVVEASLQPHMQNMPRPRGADGAGLLLRELELHPPAEEWHRRNMFGGPWSDPEDLGLLDETTSLSLNDYYEASSNRDSYFDAQNLWPRKRRFSERDAAFGLRTTVGLGSYLGIMGSRRDVITALWKTGLEGVWYKCIRCLRQTSAFAPPASESAVASDREAWWISRWAHSCPMCGGSWVRVV